jgi:hypothetical protein
VPVQGQLCICGPIWGVGFDEFGTRDAAQVHLKNKNIFWVPARAEYLCARCGLSIAYCFSESCLTYTTYGRASAASYAKRSRSRRTSPLSCSKWKCGLRNQTETKSMSCAPVNRCKRDLVG